MQTLGRKTTQSPPGKSCQVQAHSINFSTTPNVPCNKQATLGKWGCEPHSGWASLVLFVICAGWGGGRVISRPCCADVLRSPWEPGPSGRGCACSAKRAWCLWSGATQQLPLPRGCPAWLLQALPAEKPTRDSGDQH